MQRSQEGGGHQMENATLSERLRASYEKQPPWALAPYRFPASAVGRPKAAFSLDALGREFGVAGIWCPPPSWRSGILLHAIALLPAAADLTYFMYLFIVSPGEYVPP